MDGSGPPLLIVAASGRSLAASALRAGYSPIVIDQFGDFDLSAIATVKKSPRDRFAESAEEFAASLAPMPWLYGGGIENEPGLVERISMRHQLVGIPADTLRLVRDPSTLEACLDTFGIPRARRYDPDKTSLASFPLIVKPVRSAGGLNVRLFDKNAAFDPLTEQIQEYLIGPTFGAVYLADDRGTELVGFTRLTSGGQSTPGPFVYVGSLGPWRSRRSTTDQFRRAGEAVGQGFDLRGLFGIDFVAVEREPRVIEVNPRPTASVEVLELATGRPLLAEHLACFGWGGRRETVKAPGYAVKRIVYANREFMLPKDWDWSWFDVDESLHPSLVDLPWPGIRVQKGEPLLSLLASDRSMSGCLSRSRKLRERVERIVDDWSDPRL